jgi:hypothetical protein
MRNIGAGSDAEPGDMQPHLADPDPRAVEQLLDGHSGGTDALGRLLAAARVTGGRADQAGLDQALADFAHNVSAPAEAVGQPKRSLLKVALARLAAAKMMLVVALAVIATGGIALAATTGTIPNPLSGSSHQTVTSSPTDATLAPDSSPPGRDQSTPAATPTAVSAPTSATPTTISSAMPSAGVATSFTGLCKSWLARPHTNGKADNGTAFQRLIAAAGDEAAVDGYCTALLATSVATSTAPAAADTTAPAGKKTHSDGKVTGKAS